MKARDQRIVKARAKGKTVREIAESEGMSPRGAFLACKRLDKHVVTALKRIGYDLHKSVGDMAEMANAYETKTFVINDQIVEHDIPDNQTRLKARTRLFNLHVGDQANGQFQGSQTFQGPTMVILGMSNGRLASLCSNKVLETMQHEAEDPSPETASEDPSSSTET